MNEFVAVVLSRLIVEFFLSIQIGSYQLDFVLNLAKIHTVQSNVSAGQNVENQRHFTNNSLIQR